MRAEGKHITRRESLLVQFYFFQSARIASAIFHFGPTVFAEVYVVEIFSIVSITSRVPSLE